MHAGRAEKTMAKRHFSIEPEQILSHFAKVIKYLMDKSWGRQIGGDFVPDDFFACAFFRLSISEKKVGARFPNSRPIKPGKMDCRFQYFYQLNSLAESSHQGLILATKSNLLGRKHSMLENVHIFGSRSQVFWETRHRSENFPAPIDWLPCLISFRAKPYFVRNLTTKAMERLPTIAVPSTSCQISSMPHLIWRGRRGETKSHSVCNFLISPEIRGEFSWGIG